MLTFAIRRPALEDRGLTLPRAHLDSDHWARVLGRRWPLDTRRFGGRALVQETAALDPGKRIVASSRRCKTLIVVILVSWRSVACRPQRWIWRIPTSAQAASLRCGTLALPTIARRLEWFWSCLPLVR